MLNRIASDQIMTWLIKTKTEHIFGLGMVSPAWFTKDDNQSGVEINRLGQYDVLRGKYVGIPPIYKTLWSRSVGAEWTADVWYTNVKKQSLASRFLISIKARIESERMDLLCCVQMLMYWLWQRVGYHLGAMK